MRDITIPESLALELMAFGTDLCFTNVRGGYLRRNCFRSEYWLRAVRKAGIPGLRVHDCADVRVMPTWRPGPWQEG
jgi:hypothetical protein